MEKIAIEMETDTRCNAVSSAEQQVHKIHSVFTHVAAANTMFGSHLADLFFHRSLHVKQGAPKKNLWDCQCKTATGSMPFLSPDQSTEE